MVTKPSKKTAPSKKKKVNEPSKKAPVVKSPAKGKPKAPTGKKGVAKTASTKISGHLSLDPKPPRQKPLIPRDEIALRAYFIAERRHKMGWPGNSSTDWIDAEKQLRTEALEKPLKKR